MAAIHIDPEHVCNECQHWDCRELRAQMRAPCTVCRAPIGGEPFYIDDATGVTAYTHAACFPEREETNGTADTRSA